MIFFLLLFFYLVYVIWLISQGAKEKLELELQKTFVQALGEAEALLNLRGWYLGNHMQYTISHIYFFFL